MPPKSSAAGKEKLIDDEEEVLQAVILADSFNKRFRPLTARKPRCLLPICNAPLLDWTFESLALAGVQEIFVICRSFAEQVKAAIKESRWSKPGSGIKIVPILTAKETFSPGDAMRDIYTRGLVTSDFVLVMGDLVSNIRIDEVVRVHKERRKTNKDAIMTMVVKESGARHRTKARGDSSIFVLDSETSECLHYEPVTGYPQTKVAHIPREILASHAEIEIRNDLIDCSIDVCSVEVPSLFQDNFDYLDIRKDFVHGVLTSDLLMKNIHCYVAKDGYAARVKDTKSYDSISKDILSRWTFPLVPDDNHPGGHVYEHIRGNKYIPKDNSVVLARTAKVGSNTLIGSSTQIHEKAEVSASVIGQNCTIGVGTIVRNAYVFNGTKIGSNCVIERSIIGAGVQIKDNSRVEKGCLIGDGVIVGPVAVLGPFGKLSKRRDKIAKDETSDAEDEEDVDSDLEEVEANQDSIPKTLGKDSNAIVWPNGPPDDSDEEDELDNYKNERFMRLGDDASDLYFSDDGSATSESDSELSDEDSDFDMDPNRSLTAPSDTSLPLDIPSAGMPMAESEFRVEVTQSLERAFAEGHSVDNAAVELKTLRMASNVPLTRVREAVVAAIVEKIQIVDGGGASQRKEIAAVIGRWGALIDNIGGIDAVETISALQTHCASSMRMSLFGQILAALYQDDIVEEDDVRKWHVLPASKGEGRKPSEDIENIKKCWMIGAHMIKQFDEQESDDEDDSEDEEEPPATKKDSTEEEEEEESEDEESEDEEEIKQINEGLGQVDKPGVARAETNEKLPLTDPPTTNPVVTAKESKESEEESEEESGAESQDEEPKATASSTIKPSAAELSEDEESEEDSQDEQPQAIAPPTVNAPGFKADREQDDVGPEEKGSAEASRDNQPQATASFTINPPVPGPETHGGGSDSGSGEDESEEDSQDEEPQEITPPKITPPALAKKESDDGSEESEEDSQDEETPVTAPSSPANPHMTVTVGEVTSKESDSGSDEDEGSEEESETEPPHETIPSTAQFQPSTGTVEGSLQPSTATPSPVSASIGGATVLLGEDRVENKPKPPQSISYPAADSGTKQDSGETDEDEDEEDDEDEDEDSEDGARINSDKSREAAGAQATV